MDREVASHLAFDLSLGARLSLERMVFEPGRAEEALCSLSFHRWTVSREDALSMSKKQHALYIGGWSRVKEELDNESSRKTLAKM